MLRNVVGQPKSKSLGSCSCNWFKGRTLTNSSHFMNPKFQKRVERFSKKLIVRTLLPKHLRTPREGFLMVNRHIGILQIYRG